MLCFSTTKLVGTLWNNPERRKAYSKTPVLNHSKNHLGEKKSYFFGNSIACDASRDSVPFVQCEKLEKHP